MPPKLFASCLGTFHIVHNSVVDLCVYRCFPDLYIMTSLRDPCKFFSCCRTPLVRRPGEDQSPQFPGRLWGRRGPRQFYRCLQVREWGRCFQHWATTRIKAPERGQCASPAFERKHHGVGSKIGASMWGAPHVANA